MAVPTICNRYNCEPVQVVNLLHRTTSDKFAAQT